MLRLLERVNFPKLVTVLTVTFSVALGACGLTAIASKWAGPYVLSLGIIELVVMVLSAAGLLISVILWIVVAAIGDAVPGRQETIKLFDNSDNTKH